MADLGAVVERVLAACEVATSFEDAARVLQASVPQGDEERYRSGVWALGYHLVARSREQVRDRVGGPFGAAWEIDGQRFPPALSDLPDGTIEEWRELFGAADHPVVRARVGDLLWTVKAQPRPDRCARAAVDAYLRLRAEDGWHQMQRVRCIERALELAREVGDVGRLEAGCRIAVEWVEADLADADARPGVAMTLLRALHDLAAPIDAAELDRLLVWADERFGADPHIADGIAELRIRVGADADRLRKEQVQRWRAVAGEAEGMLRVHYLERALETARLHGLGELADDLRRELQDIPTDELDLKTVTTEVEIRREEADALIAAIVEQPGWRESLTRFGAQGPPAGDEETLAADVDAEMHEFPLQYLFSKVVVGPDRATALFRATDPESHRRLAIAERRMLAASFWGTFAVEILKRIPAHHGRPSPEELTAFFTTELIPGEAAEGIGRALELYWDSQFDESAHMLAPRLEAVVRELARRAGIPIIYEPIGDRPGGVRPLGTLLGELAPTFAEPAWHAYLFHLLADPLGLNLRNSIAHGLEWKVQSGNAALLVHAACYLRLLGIKDSDDASS